MLIFRDFNSYFYYRYPSARRRYCNLFANLTNRCKYVNPTFHRIKNYPPYVKTNTIRNLSCRLISFQMIKLFTFKNAFVVFFLRHDHIFNRLDLKVLKCENSMVNMTIHY